ncbi:MAG: ABC transporter substrate-binding protein, partial [Anaerotruncus massiliensis (ex Togo et al. 2019)]
MKRVLAIVLSAVMALTLLAGCGDNSTPAPAPAGDNAAPAADAAPAAGGDVIKIGVFEPQTGENGGGGLQEVYGIRYANQQFPTVKVGDKEYKIELVEADNKSDKTEAVTAAQSLISAGCSVILGSYGSGVSSAAGEIFSD